MLEDTLHLSTWHIEVAKYLRDLENCMSRDEIVDCLYRVFEELQYIDGEVEVDQQTRQGFVVLNKLLFTILRSGNTPDPAVSLRKI